MLPSIIFCSSAFISYRTLGSDELEEVENGGERRLASKLWRRDVKSVSTMETNLFFFPFSEAQLAEKDGPPSVSLNCRRWLSCESGGPSSPLSFVQPFWSSFAVFAQLAHTSCVEFFSF